MGFWKSIWETRAQSWLKYRFKSNQVPDGKEPAVIQPNAAYANVWLRSARVVNLRTGLRRFYGAVHSRVTLLPVAASDEVEVNTVVAPGFLKDIDARNLDRVISIDHRLLGPIAHSGNDVSIEVGLFSIAEADLVAPYLGMLESISNIAGVGFINTAMQLAGPIKDGLNAILSGGGDNILEIGLSQTFQPLETGFYLVMRVEKDKLDPAMLRLDAEGWHVVGADGEPVKDFPYMVLEVVATSEKYDFAKIPELNRQYDLVKAAINRGDAKEGEAAQLVFRRLALTSRELIRRDAERLAKLVKDEVDAALGGPIPQTGFVAPPAKELEELKLYSEPE